MPDAAIKTDELIEKLLPEELLEIAGRREAVGIGPIPGLEREIASVRAARARLDEARREAGRQWAAAPLVQRWLHVIRPAPGISGAEEAAGAAAAAFEKAKAAMARRLAEGGPPGLVGLALSGGGIRSATFNLGVLQALASTGLLERVDYLSTVSGGGFIGGCLSSLLDGPGTGTDPERFPLRHVPGEVEPDAVKHLRNSGRYLTGEGLSDVLLGLAHLFRGIVTHFMIMFPYIVGAVWITLRCCGRERFGRPFGLDDWYDLTKGFGLVLLAWLALFPLVYFIFGAAPRLRSLYDRSLAWGLFVFPVLFLAESLPPLIRWYHGILRLHAFSPGHGWSATLALLLPFLLSGRAASAVKRVGGRVGLCGLGLLGPLVLLSIYLNLGNWAVYGEMPWIGTGLGFGRVVYPIAWLVWLYAYLFVDVNVTSMHDFYRSKLSSAYLIRGSEPLSAMGATGKTGPYHLINAALNLQGSKDPSYRGRKADFFLFSKHFVGSRCTGYAATADVEQADPHIDLAAAMAISGAAAAPNMGTTTIRPLVFVMALLNIRLDYWLPHPGYLGGARRNRAARALKVGPICFLLELLGLLDEKGPKVNVSDGCHIENLGIYELLRRKCRLIIASDAEEDPALSCGGLVNLIRLARIDRGIDIEIDLGPIRGNDQGLSGRHFAVGRIDYGEGNVGHILYIKSSLVSDENVYIKEYRSRHPKFPHETGADQSFDEAQFEVYRALGHHVARAACVGYQGGDPGPWVQSLWAQSAG